MTKPLGEERRPYIDGVEGYFESDKDFVLNNLELCLRLLRALKLDPLYEEEE